MNRIRYVLLMAYAWCCLLFAAGEEFELLSWRAPGKSWNDMLLPYDVCAVWSEESEVLDVRPPTPPEIVECFEKTWLDDASNVWLVYLPKNGERYSVMYDVRGQYLCVRCFPYGGVAYTANRPMEAMIKDEFLKGYIWKEGRAASGLIRSTDACLEDCYEQSFLSCPLHDFLLKVCLHQEASRERIQDATLWEPLTKKVLQKMRLPLKDIRWSVCDEGRFWQTVFMQRRANNEVFLAVRDEGFLRGVFEWRNPLSFHERKAAPERSLFQYKMRNSDYFFWGTLSNGYKKEQGRVF